MPLSTTGRADRLRAVVELTKLPITAMVVLTSATGYLLAARRLEWAMCLPLLGTFLLASGSAALNQWQEYPTDARMPRTCGRPIPAGKVDPSWAFFLAMLFILLGLFLLTSGHRNSTTLFLLGLAALLWYNGVYTHLKRVTAFAVVPGALIGAVPPCMGYVAAGGSAHDPSILLLATFFFIWQIPHFWLLVLMFASQYHDAGLPTVAGTFARPQLARITFMWMLAAATAGLAFPALNRAELPLPWSLALVVASVWLAVKSAAILKPPVGEDEKTTLRRAFRRINAYALMVIASLSLGALAS